MIDQVLQQLDSLQRELARINPLHTTVADQVASMALILRKTVAIDVAQHLHLGERQDAKRVA